MSELSDKYESLKKTQEILALRIKQLERDSNVMDYKRLNRELDNVMDDLYETYREIKLNEYNNCNHLAVMTEKNRDHSVGRNYYSVGCIKCGMNEKALSKSKFLRSVDENVMAESFCDQSFEYDLIKDYVVDLDLAHAIYKKIKENHPNINDKLATKYFEIALDNIRDIEVNESRKQSRIKRLGLKPNFKNWK